MVFRARSARRTRRRLTSAAAGRWPAAASTSAPARQLRAKTPSRSGRRSRRNGADDEEGLEVAERRPLGEAFEAGHRRGGRAAAGRRPAARSPLTSSRARPEVASAIADATLPMARTLLLLALVTAVAGAARVDPTTLIISPRSAPHAARARLLRGVFRRRGCRPLRTTQPQRRRAPTRRRGRRPADQPTRTARVHVAGQPARRGRVAEDPRAAR